MLLFSSDDRVQPNRCIRLRWPVVYFRLIANFLNASAITIRTLTFGAVKILSCHSNRGCAVEHWKSCHARMLDIYLESDLRTRYVHHTSNCAHHVLQHFSFGFYDVNETIVEHRDARCILRAAVILPIHAISHDIRNTYCSTTTLTAFVRFHFVFGFYLASCSGVRV